MKKLLYLLVPGLVVTLWYMIRCRAMVSPRAEVDLTSRLQLGEGAVISAFSKIKANGPLSIGRNVAIGSSCFISSDAAGVTIGDDCMISANASIIGNNYRYNRTDVPIRLQEKTSKGITIERDVWLGAGVVVLDGAHVGEGSIIVPNTVVSGKVARGSVVQGNPAKVIFTRR